MPKDPLKLSLQPSLDGSSTRLLLCGSVTGPIPSNELGQWLRLLSSWTGLPVELALPAAEATGEWFESWTDAIAELPVHHLQIRFILETDRRACGGRDAA
jgi:hypothetical protein